MEKIMKNKKNLELVNSHLTGYKTKFGKIPLIVTQ